MKAQSQRGVVLLAGLMLLLSLAALGVIAATSAALQARMAGNAQADLVALAWSDQAMREAETWLFDLPMEPLPELCENTCGPGVPIHLHPPGDAWPAAADRDWWVAHGQPTVRAWGDDNGNGTWFVDMIEEATDGHGEEVSLHWYRVWARGTAREGDAVAVTQSLFARPFGLPDGETPPWPEFEHWREQCGTDDLPTCGRVAWRRAR